MKKITIKNENLPTNEVQISTKNKWAVPDFHKKDYQTEVTLTEKQIYENAARAVADLEKAEETLRLAQQRVESMRVFVNALVKPEQLSVVNG